MSIANNCFSLLPWDAKREISSYLALSDAATFNGVLRRDERVYKKLPRDFALKHAIGILKQEHNSIVRRFQFCQDANDFRGMRRAAKDMIRFCLHPRSEIAFQHQMGVREKLLEFLEPLADVGSDVWEGATAARVEKMVGFARAALEVVGEMRLVRHIALPRAA